MKTGNTTTLEELKIAEMPTNIKKYFMHLHTLPVTPPKNGKQHSPHHTRWHSGFDEIGNPQFAQLNEYQTNFASLLSTGKFPIEDCWVMAGYAWMFTFKHWEDETLSQIKKNVYGNAKDRQTVAVTRYINYLKKNPAQQLIVDAAWVLNEQVKLYEETKAEKEYQVAARVLNDIAGHVHVDAKARTKLEVESTVDYAALLNEANGRLEVIDTSTIDGEKLTEAVPHIIVERE